MSKPRRKYFELQLFTEENIQEAVVEETQVQEESQPNEEEYDVIQYNKEEVKIPASQRREYLEKGYNYDKIKGRAEEYKTELEQIKSSKELSFMNKFLADNGYSSFEEYETALNVQDVMDKNPGISKDVAMKILKAEQIEAQEQKQALTRQQEEQKQQQQTAMIQNFIKNFPDADTENLPDEVVDMVRNGTDLSIAYELHNLRKGTDRKAIEQEVLEQLQNNKTITSGSASTGAPPHKTSIKDMSKEDFAKLKNSVLRGETREI